MTTLALTILFAVTVAFGALVGLIRGLNKATIRLITLVLAAVLTFVVAGPVTTAIVQEVKIEGMTLGQMILDALTEAEMMANIMESAPLLKEAILVAPAFVISIVVFPVLFFVLKFITWIVFLFVQKPLRKLIFKDNCNKQEYKQQPKGIRAAKRFGGLGVGLVTGALIFGMIMTPFLGLFTVLPSKNAMDTALDMLAEQNILSESDVETIRTELGVTDSALINFYRLVGLTAAGRAYLDSTSKIQADGYTSSLTNEVGSLMATVQAAIEGGLVNALLSPEDTNALYAVLGDKQVMDDLMQAMFQSKLLCAAVPEVMAYAMETVASSMNVPANKEVVYNNMMDSVAQAVKDADIDYAGIEAYEKANNMAGRFARSNSKDKTENETEGLTQEWYEAEIQKLVKLASTISSILNKSVAGDNKAITDSIADHIVNEVKAQAANGGDALVNFDASSVQSAIATVDPSTIEADGADQLLEQLTNQEKFETDVPTVETITESIRESVKTAVADEAKAGETASTLASVVSNFAEAVASATDENGEIDITKMDFAKIGEAVSSLQNSNLKDVGSSVLDIVVSGDLGSNQLVSDVLGAVKEGYENGEDVGGTIGTAGALIGLGSAMGGTGEDGEVSEEAVVNSLVGLINNLNEFTISLLPSILSADTFESMGIPAEYADAAYSVVETLLTELMALKGAEDYESEVNAILALYNLATSGVENFTEEDIIDLVNHALESDAICNTIVSISTSNPFGIEMPDEDTREEIANTIEEFYAESAQTERIRTVCEAIATLLGVEEDVKLG